MRVGLRVQDLAQEEKARWLSLQLDPWAQSCHQGLEESSSIVFLCLLSILIF